MDTARQVVTCLGIAFGIALNVVFAGRVSGVSAAGELPLDAAPYAFSIWGLIFVGQAAYAVYQALPSQHDRTLHRSVGRWAAVNGVAQGLWVLAILQQQFVLSWMLILVMLGALGAIEVAVGARRHGLERPDRWLVRAPFAINLGWVSVALFLATASLLEGVVRYQGQPVGPVVWGVAAVAALSGLAMAMLLLRENAFFGAVSVWALVAIAIGSRGAAPIVAAAVVGAAAVALTTALVLARRRVEPPAGHVRAA
jgi:hypothetical protein